MPVRTSPVEQIADMHRSLVAAGLPTGFMLPLVHAARSRAGLVVHVGACRHEVLADAPVAALGELASQGALCKGCASKLLSYGGTPLLAGPRFVHNASHRPGAHAGADKHVRLDWDAVAAVARTLAAVDAGQAAAHEAATAATRLWVLIDRLRSAARTSTWPAADMSACDELLTAFAAAHARLVAYSAVTDAAVPADRVCAALVTALHGGCITLDAWGDALIELVGTAPGVSDQSSFTRGLTMVASLDHDGFVAAAEIAPGPPDSSRVAAALRSLIHSGSTVALGTAEFAARVPAGTGTPFDANFAADLAAALTEPREGAAALLSTRILSVLAGPVAERVAARAAQRFADQVADMCARWGSPSQWHLVLMRHPSASEGGRAAACQAARALFPSRPAGQASDVVAVPDWFPSRGAAALFHQEALATVASEPSADMLAVFVQLMAQADTLGSSQAAADAAWQIASAG